MLHEVNFQAGFNWFEFRVYFFPSPFAILKLKSPSSLLFVYSWMENSWIHAFPKAICSIWNTKDLVQDLSFGRRVHFLRR